MRDFKVHISVSILLLISIAAFGQKSISLLDPNTNQNVKYLEVIEKSNLVIDEVLLIKRGNSIYKRVYNGVIELDWYNKLSELSISDRFQMAINVAEPNDAILVKGIVYCDKPLIINKTLTIFGTGYVNGNDTGSGKNSRIYFTKPFEKCIISKDLNLKNITIMGNNADVGTGIYAKGTLTLDGVTIQLFKTGVHIVEGYYNKFSNSTITYCNKNLLLDYCYNSTATAVNFDVRSSGNSENLTNIELLNGSQLSLFGCSIESFNNAGVIVKSNSSILLQGTYFEGVSNAKLEAYSLILGEGARVSALSVHSYHTKNTARGFIKVMNGVKSIYLYARNNQFKYSVNKDWSSVIYNFGPNKNLGDFSVDISGDNYQDPYKANTYSTLSYLNVKKNIGDIKIIYPFNHPLFKESFTTVDILKAK